MALKPGQPKINKVELTGSHCKCPHVPCSVLLPMQIDFDSLVKGVSNHLVKVHHRKVLHQDNCSFFIRCETRENTISKEELEKWLMFKEPRPPIAAFIKQSKMEDFHKSLCRALRVIPKTQDLAFILRKIRTLPSLSQRTEESHGRFRFGKIQRNILYSDPACPFNACCGSIDGIRAQRFTSWQSVNRS
ncbi:hypothetical protein CAEBREN_21689 [Caenorhabditis brenneri]|uniref:Uncharacterized protein n=1 Tax=Caenorhabditis brenneri TaxID=135651 RepID=G0P0S0_CAEBE|nr:hypothetical protein CAEBREN_21689 [Caenorhabditis brenneri]